MFRWCLSLLVWCSFRAAAFASNVDIRSGLHDGFTRMYLAFPQAHEWQFGATENGLLFATDLPDAQFTLENAFDRIARERIGSLEQRPDGGLDA